MKRNGLLIGLISVLFFLLVSASSSHAGRGLKVKLKKSEQPGAPVTEEVTLYGSSYALVIGIDDYRAGWPRLSGAVKDAHQVAAELEKNGFEVRTETNLNAGELKDTFNNFFIFKGENPDARLFVWFAGHGHTLNGEGYLVPTDAPLPSKNEAQFKYKALSLRRFGEYVRQAKSKHVLAVFDSCFSGTIFSTQRSAPPAAITRSVTLPVRQFISSGDADQEVSDDGRFRKLFIRALRGEERADANGDGYLTGSELSMFLTDRVTNLTNSMQTPRHGKLRDENYDRGDFVFQVAGSAQSAATQWQETSQKPGKNGFSTAPEPGTPQRGSLDVTVAPEHAQIRFMNYRKRFLQGMDLSPGEYELEISADGYETRTLWVEIEDGKNKDLRVSLKRVHSKQSDIVDKPQGPSAPPEPAGVSVTLEYAGDPYGCVLDLAITVAGETIVPESNTLVIPNVPRGNVPYAINGTINCGFMGTCTVQGQGTLNAHEGSHYNLIWQNTGPGQCGAWFMQ